MRLPLAIALVVLALAAPAAAQSETGWKDRADPTSKASPPPSPPVEEVTPKPPTGTAEPKGKFAKVVDFFFGDTEGGEKRTWGFVPLVVADSNAGFGAGIQLVENNLLNQKVAAELFTYYTTNEFFEGQVKLTGPPIALFDWRVVGRYRSRPRLYFFGVGNETRRSGRLSMWLEDTLAEVRAGIVLAPQTFLFAVGEFSNVNIFDGLGHDVPRLSTRFNEDTLPGFGTESYTNGLGGSLVVDLRDDPLNPTEGGRLEARSLYHGPMLGDSPYRYGTYALDIAGYYPVIESWKVILAAGLRYELVDASYGRVPFYALPTLGGSRSLRGFLEGRFRDRNSILFQSEVRFPIWRVISGALFADVGRVWAEVDDPPSDFFRELHVNGGVGIRLIIQPDIFTRLDFAISSEDFTFALEFGNAF